MAFLDRTKPPTFPTSYNSYLSYYQSEVVQRYRVKTKWNCPGGVQMTMEFSEMD